MDSSLIGTPHTCGKKVEIPQPLFCREETLVGVRQQLQLVQEQLAETQLRAYQAERLLEEAGKIIWEHHELGYLQRSAGKVGPCELCEKTNIFARIKETLPRPIRMRGPIQLIGFGANTES
jgi:hypothetical protein